jgi:hypothetical protein
MSARAIVSDAPHKAAEERVSKAGKPFATLTLRENFNGSPRVSWKLTVDVFLSAHRRGKGRSDV